MEKGETGKLQVLIDITQYSMLYNMFGKWLHGLWSIPHTNYFEICSEFLQIDSFDFQNVVISSEILQINNFDFQSFVFEDQSFSPSSFTVKHSANPDNFEDKNCVDNQVDMCL